MGRKCSLLVVLLSVCFAVACQGQQPPMRLVYDRPAAQWEETLPLGNGRLGMMPDGGIGRERIVLNDITLWSGAPQDANNYEAYKQLPRIRQLLLEGKNDEAQAIIDQSFICKGKGSGGTNYGCFQTLGELGLTFTYAGGDSQAVEYHRELSLDSAVAGCSYRIGGTVYSREYFSSFGDDVNMIRLRSDRAGQLTLRVDLGRPERGTVSTREAGGGSGGLLELTGQLDNGIDGKGMRYRASVGACLRGGKLRVEKDHLFIEGATEVILYLSAGTDWKAPAFEQRIARVLETARHRSYAQERRMHIDRYRKLFGRVAIDLGVNELAGNATTDKRLNNFHGNPNSDNGLPVLFYQFGRYLSISSTRVGLLPPNLQGLWANQVSTPWNGDYHLDINVQMNHWPVEVSNLAELDLPLADLVQGMVPNGERTAKAYYNAEGWVAHVITNIWGFTEPGESASWGVTKCGSGWLCNNLWEHYAFTNDKDYLRRIYPILSGAARFYNSMLIEEPVHGWLVTSPSSSPENGFYLPNGNHASICMGPTIDNQIIRELFGHVLEAAALLGEDEALRKELSARLEKLPPPGVVAKDGRLMEWLEDYRELEPHHRCISHLYGLFPASLITPESTPDLAEACKKTLEARGDEGPGFTKAYKMLWWARLHDGNRAYELFTSLIHPTLESFINYGAGGGIYPNLLSAGPPFQIDGNFGATAGIAEMLLQSHAGFIELLPAIPDAWKPIGSVRGLKARGNFTVDMRWKNGKVTGYRISSPTPRKLKVKVNGIVQEIVSLSPNHSLP